MSVDTYSTTKYSEDGFQRMLGDMNGILDQFSDLKAQYNALDLGLYTKYDDGGLLQILADHITTQGNDLFTLIRNLELYEKRIQEEIRRGVWDIESVEDVHCSISAFGLASAATAAVIATYASHESYQCLVNSGLSFSKDFNDLQTFINSDFYKWKSAATTGSSMITDWSMWGKVISGQTDELTDGWLEASLTGVLNGMSEAAPDKLTTITDWAKDATGVQNLDDWLKGIASLAKKYAAAGKNQEEFLNSKELKEALDQVTGMEKEDVKGFLKCYFDEDTWGRALNQIEWIDVIISGASHALTDHTAQLQYLATMKKALVENGNIYGSAYRCVEELQRQYRSSAYNAVKTVWNKAKGEIIKGSAGEAMDLIPGLNTAKKILSTGSTVVKLTNAKSISADKQLMGLRQYDEVLTRAFEGYAQKMKDGMATQADLQDADRLYRLLLGTKKKEYESMLDMIGPKGMAYGIYNDKYNKLLEMERTVSDATQEPAVPISDLLGKYSETYHT